MADRYALVLKTALASNTGGPYTAIWDQAVVPSAGTITTAWAVATSLSSNARQNTADVFLQTDAPSAGSNTATTVLVTPITLANNRDSVQGTVRAGNNRVAAGDIVQLRTDAATAGSTPSFVGLTATVEIERD